MALQDGVQRQQLCYCFSNVGTSILKILISYESFYFNNNYVGDAYHSYELIDGKCMTII